MRPLTKPLVLGSSFLLGIGIAIAAGPAHSAEQLAVLPPSAPSTGASIGLPEVVVRPVAPYALPYTNGGGPRVSSYSIPRSEHRGSMPGDADPMMHPYTSGLGPRISSNPALRVEHYNVPADYDSNVAMHPYTSLQGPCAEGGNAGGDICKRLVPPSKHRRPGEGR